MPIYKISTTNLILQTYGETVVDIYYDDNIKGRLSTGGGRNSTSGGAGFFITDIVFKFSNKDIRKFFDTSDIFSKNSNIFTKNSYDTNGQTWSVNIVSINFFTLTLSSDEPSPSSNGKFSLLKLGTNEYLNTRTETGQNNALLHPPKILFTSPILITNVISDTQLYDLIYSDPNNLNSPNIYLQTDVNKINFNYILKEHFVYDYLTHIIINSTREVTIENVNNINIPNDKNVIIENDAILNMYGYKDDLENFKRQYILTNETPNINTITQTTYQSVNNGILNLFYKKPIQNINYNSELKLLTFDIHHVSHISKINKQYNFSLKLYTIKKGNISEFQTIKDSLENITVNSFNEVIKQNNTYLVPNNNCNPEGYLIIEYYYYFEGEKEDYFNANLNENVDTGLTNIFIKHIKLHCPIKPNHLKLNSTSNHVQKTIIQETSDIANRKNFKHKIFRKKNAIDQNIINGYNTRRINKIKNF